MRIRGIRWASPLAAGLGMALPLQRYLPLGMDVAKGRDATETGAGNALTVDVMPEVGGYAMRGDGSDRYLSLRSLLEFMTNSEGSISAWVKTDADNADNGLWSLGNGESRYDYSTGLWGHAALTTFGTTSGSMSSVDTSRPHLLTITVAPGGAWKAYIDGKQWSTASLTFVTSHTTWKLGASATSSTYALAGLMAHFLAWDRALSAEEVWSLYDPASRWDVYDFAPVMVALFSEQPAGTTHEVAISMPGSGGISAAESGVFERSASLSASAGISPDSDGTLGRAAAFATDAGTSADGDATLLRALSLPGSAGLSAAVDSALNATIALAGSGGVAVDKIATLQRAATLATDAALQVADETTVERAIALAGSGGLSLVSDSAIEVSIGLAGQAAIAASEIATIEAAAAFAGSGGISTDTAGSTFDRAALMAATGAISASALAVLERAAALGASAGFTVSGGQVYEAGLTLAATATITAAGTVVNVTISTPDGRTLTIEADGRTLTIEADDRTLII